MSLILFNKKITVPGVEIIPPKSHGGPSWSMLDPGDFGPRRAPIPSQIVLHTTKGIWPQRIVPGVGPMGRAEHVARYWNRDPLHSAAQIVVGSDGVTACLCDLGTTAAYHATVANQRSIGIEIYQELDGSIFASALDAAVRVTMALCEAADIPPIMLGAHYGGAPLAELMDGGEKYAGIFGHRSNTGRRGRGDPGDEIFTRLALVGAESMDVSDYHAKNIARQKYLVQKKGARLDLDGVPGPVSIAAARAAGYARWRFVPSIN